MSVYLHPKNYYRLPWSLTDNAIAWLEPTWKCNIVNTRNTLPSWAWLLLLLFLNVAAV